MRPVRNFFQSTTGKLLTAAVLIFAAACVLFSKVKEPPDAATEKKITHEAQPHGMEFSRPDELDLLHESPVGAAVEK